MPTHSMRYRSLESENWVVLRNLPGHPIQANRVEPHYRYEYLKKRMEKEGIEYVWWRDTLGGFGKIKEETIKDLADWQAGQVLCLMCMEADPMKCHRHLRVATRRKAYQLTAHHIVKDGDGFSIMEA